MIKEKSLKQITPEPQPRPFGLVLGFILVYFGVWRPWPAVVWTHPLVLASFILLTITLWRPQLLMPLLRWWLKLANFFSAFTNPLLLAIFYFIFLTPMALVFRLLAKDSFARRFKQANSAWQDCEPSTDFHRQF